MSSPAGVLWRGPLTDPSGYAAEGRAFVRGLVEEGVRLRVDPAVWHYREAVTPGERERLADLMETELPTVEASVQHTFGRLFDPYAPGRLRIGRTMFETDRVPRDWVVRCNQMDEVWVPSDAGREAFAAAGVDRDRLAVIPSPLELDRLDPDADPLGLPDAHGTVFLAAFDWTLRKGWDVLLSAWCEAFSADDDVTLVLKTWSTSRGLDTEAIADELKGHVRSLGHDPGRIPDIVLFDRLLSERRMSALYRAADAYVAPSRGEGWGRPAVEAMAVGRPVIATDWSGPSAYLDSDVGWPVGHRLVEVSAEAVAEVAAFAGHRWAEPDRDDLIEALRAVHADPADARRRGERARRRALEFDHRRVARAILARLGMASPRPRPGSGGSAQPPVVLEGPILASHSLAGVNRELGRALMARGGMDLALVDTQGIDLDVAAEPALAPLVAATERLLPAPPALTVRLRYPPVFDAPSSGRLALVLPWEFGPIPSGWAARLDDVDEVWVLSRWSRRGFIESGVPEERVAVVPLGVDPERFRPGLDPLPLGDDVAPGFRFLFVGGFLWRKGIDILLDAYERAFRREDEVTLLLKDFGALGPYVPQEAAERVARLVADRAAPRIAHFTGTLPETEMPRLYAAADCLVHPYRGEGYGLPIAEAMACGLPVIIPDRGAACDFTTPETSVGVTSRVVRGEAEVGGHRLSGPSETVEIDPDDLAVAMRRVYERPEEGRAVGARASAVVRADHTWQATARIAADRMAALLGEGVPA